MMQAEHATRRLTPGFAEPVQQAQQVYRQVLAAMAEPGSLQRLPELAAPEGMDSASWQVCLALLDQETPLWIAPGLASAAAIEALRFHAGCPLVEAPASASFVLSSPQWVDDLSRFNQGSHKYPDRSATLILQVAGLDQGGELLLNGPGIAGQRAVSIEGFDQHWLDMLAANHAGFPLGVDLILCAGQWLMALPRSIQIRREA